MHQMKEDVHKKYVEMHLMYNKYLKDELSGDPGGGLRGNLENMLKDGGQYGSRTNQDLREIYEEVKRDE